MFPNYYILKIIDKNSKLPVSSIAVKVTVCASKKNDYHLLPTFSNQEGIIEFSKEWLTKEIDKERNLFIMDYSSPLQDCKPYLEIKILSDVEIDNILDAMKLYKDIVEYSFSETDLKQVNNYNYQPCKLLVNLTEEQTIIIVLELEKINT